MANKSAVRPVYSLTGGTPLAKSYPEAASQTFVKGEPVYLSSGYVTAFDASADNGTQTFLGFAAEDAHNDAANGTHDVMVDLGFGNVFEANVSSNGSDQVTAVTQVGTKYPLYHDSTNSIVAVDIADTGGKIDCAIVIDVKPRAAVGETNGRVLFTLAPAALQVAGA